MDEEAEIDPGHVWSSGLDEEEEEDGGGSPSSRQHQDEGGAEAAEEDLVVSNSHSGAEVAERVLQRELDRLKKDRDAATLKRSKQILGHIFQDPFTKNKKVLMLKAFFKWSKMLPLNLKCDQLARQLQERLAAFTSLRDSYYRDVVSVKLHLTKIKDFELSGSEDLAKAKALQADLYSVHALPSVNFQALLERAQRTDESSLAMQQNLVQAGLINVTTGKAFNPWEKGKSFGKVMKQKKGSHYRLPATEGESISAAAPSTHDLFVKYCKSCVGIMQFTRTWNEEVEDAMRLKSVSNSMGKDVSDLKFTVGQLNNIIRDQETQLWEKTAVIQRLRDAGVWMKSWTYQQEALEREGGLNQQILVDAMRQGMLAADLESTVVVLQERREGDKSLFVLREARLNQRLLKEQESKDRERSLRMSMHENLSISEAAGAEKDAVIAKLRAENTAQKESLDKLNASMVELLQKVEEQETALAEGADRYDRLATTSRETIEQIDYEKGLLTTEFNEKMELLDNLSAQKREDVSMIRRLQARCDNIDMKEAKEAAHRAYLASRPKHSLRVIAIVVRTAVRLSRAIAAGPPYYAAGALGRREIIKRLHESYVPALTELQACQQKIPMLEEELADARKEIGSLTYKGNEARAALATTRDANKALQVDKEELRKELREQKAALSAQIGDLKAYQETLLAKIPQLKRISHRHRVSAHLQRVLCRTLSRSLTQLHAVLRTANPEMLPVLPASLQEEDRIAAGIEADPLLAAAKAEAVFVQPTPDEEDPARAEEMLREAAAAAARKRKSELRSKFRSAFIALVKWLQKAKNDRILEGPDFRLPHASAESGQETVPLSPRDFAKLFKETSRKLVAAFVEERKKVARQTELALAEAQNVATFASMARQVIARTTHVIEGELQECRSIIRDWERREEKRLKKEAKERKKAEAKAEKQAAKLAAMQEKKNAKLAGARTSSTARPVAPRKGGGEAGASVGMDGGDVKEDVDGGGSSSVDSSRAGAAKPVTDKKQTHTGYMSMAMEGTGGGGGVPAGKAKVEFDMGFLEKPERAPSLKKRAGDSDSDDDDDDDELLESGDAETDDIPNVELEMIDRLEEELQELQLEKNGLLTELDEARVREEDLHGDVRRLEDSVRALTADVKLSRLDCDAAKDRIRLLRDAIEDNYRQRNVEMEGIRREVVEKERQEVKARRAARRHRGTQIACSVCAIRTSNAGTEADDVGENASLCSGVSVVGQFTEALQGDFVLVARARTISDNPERQTRRLPLPSTTHFSDASEQESKSVLSSDPTVAAQVAQAQKLAQHFSQPRDKATMRNYFQKKERALKAQQQPQQPQQPRSEQLVYGHVTTDPPTEEELVPRGGAARPRTANAKMYEPSAGYAHSRGHSLDEDNVGSLHYVGSVAPQQPQATSASFLGKPPSAAQGVRSHQEVRRIETNTSAFIQQQMADPRVTERARSSIPSSRTPAPPLDGVVYKRQLAAVPTRSQSATELINHLRRNVGTAVVQAAHEAPAADKNKVSLVRMERQWRLTDGDFHYRFGDTEDGDNEAGILVEGRPHEMERELDLGEQEG